MLRTDGGWFLLHKERTDRRDEKADASTTSAPARVRHLSSLLFLLLFSPSSPPLLEVRPFVEIDIDTGHWNLIHSADEPKLERMYSVEK